MNIDIVLEGKLKETYFKNATEEYKKRLSGYVNIRVLEVSSVDNYVSNLKSGDYKITMEIDGRMLSSVEFAAKLEEIEKDGFYNKIVFLIGGSEGLSDNVKKQSDFSFSMSKLTFLHQEACMILIEQVYRAIKILKKEPYHK